jgi:hypothetical protein
MMVVAGLTAGCVSDKWSGDDALRLSEAPSRPGSYRVELAGSIQPPTGSLEELNEPADVEWLATGEIVVAEYAPAVVKLYRRDGTLLRTIGGDGDGPGEFREPLLAARDSVVVVLDLPTGRLIAFRSSDGSVLSETRGTLAIPASPAMTATGEVVQRISRAMDPPLYARMNPRSGVMDSIVLPDPVEGGLPERETTWVINYQRPGGRAVPIRVAIPLGPRYLVARTDTGGWLTGWTGAYRIHVLDSTRATVFTFGRDVTPHPVSASQKDSLVSRALQRFRMFGPEHELRQGIDAGMIPDQWPVISDVHVDGRGRFWVRRPSNEVGGSDSLTIDLFASDGEWLDQLRLPAEYWPAPPHDPVFRGDEMLVMQRDEDGFPLIRIVRVVGPE